MKEIVYFKNTQTIKKVISGKYQLKFIYFGNPKEIFCTFAINTVPIFEFDIIRGEVTFHIDSEELNKEITDMVTLFSECYVNNDGEININSYIELIP